MSDKKPARQKIDFERVEREKLITSDAQEVDTVVELSLRPKKISEFIGQSSLKENLGIALTAAKKRKESVEHILLSGPPGLGKTTLAHVVAQEMGSKITATSGPAIERAGDLVGLLTNLEEGDILFIDEIHRLSKNIEEFLYPAMEDYKIDFMTGSGPGAKTIKFALKKFTLIGATTRQGLLSSPFQSRFGVSFHLEFYEPEDLKKIIERSADLLSIGIEADAALELGKRSRGTPRIANKLLRRVRDYVQVHAIEKINMSALDKALQSHGIDSMGLDALDRRVLKALIEIYNGGPVGVEAIADTLNEERDTIVDVVEPFLLKSGFLKRTSRGREVTPLCYKHLGLQADGSAKSRDLF